MMEKILRIAQVMGKMENGGVESVVMNYYRHIDRSKIQFDFIADNDSSIPQRAEIEALGGRVIEVAPYQKINRYLAELTEIFKKNEYKIVHSHLNTLSVFPLYAAKKAGVPIRIAHNHSTAGKGEYKKNIMKYMLRPFAKVNATHYAACSRYAGAWLFGEKAVDSGEVTIFNNAIDLDKFKFNEEVRSRVRRTLDIEDRFVVGHIGRFCYQKNHEFLIDIFNAVHQKNPNAVLMLIGEGDLEYAVRQKVEDKGLMDSVMFLGNRNDVHELYQAMDVFVLPSRYEGLGMVAVEAQIAGVRTIVSTEVPDDVAITDSIEFLNLSDSVERWNDKVLNGKEHPVLLKDKSDQFNIHIWSQKLEEYYGKILHIDLNKEVILSNGKK